MWISSFDCDPPILRECPPPRTMPVMPSEAFSCVVDGIGFG